MEEGIKLLKKAQDYLDDMKYPGYPFAMNAIVDLSKGYDEAIVVDEMGNEYSILEYMTKFSADVAYQGLGCTEATKGNWLTNTSMENHEDYLDSNKIKEEDFYIDNTKMVRLYFAFNAALREAQKDKSIKIIWISHDSSVDFSECKIFRTLDEVKQYIKDYYEDMGE